jgi:hypothetical protein
MKIVNLILFLFLLISCQNESDSGNNKLSEQPDSPKINIINPAVAVDENELTIEGNDIWVRTKPLTGEVIFNLNDGDICKIIEKGTEDQIKDQKDFWYKIDFNGKTGWVFGAQSNKKTDRSLNVKDFSTFLKAFTKDYIHTKEIPSKYIHSESGCIFLFNPGAYCVAYSGELSIHESKKNLSINVFPGLPKGDFCDGFPGIKDGFYYEPSDYKSLPKYADLSGADDVVGKTIELPEYLRNNSFMKVEIITEDYHFGYLYFINIETDWYLLCEDYCDCSA